MFERYLNPELPAMPQFEIPSFSESVAELVQEEVRNIEATLKPDQRLLVYSETPSGERVQVQKIQFTGGPLILVHGLDPDGNAASIMCHAFSFQMVCKVMKANQNSEKPPIGFILPKKAEEKT